MNFVSRTSADTNEENESSISSILEDLAEKADIVIDKQAKERNLDKSLVYQCLPPIDICVFGRSGIGKSQLIKAITHIDIPTSAQIDHVTQTLTEATTTIGSLKFRFWDSKGIDNWLDIGSIDNLFNEMRERKIKPIFVIYCAAAGGRVDSDIVAAILKQFQTTNILICYVITNIYAANDIQLQEQIDGGRRIMDNIFQTKPIANGRFCFEYRNTSDDNDDSIPNRQGILVGVNSCPFTSMMGSAPICNIYELMNFLAGNLNDEDFSKFVALTMNNRDFWNRASDAVTTRLLRVQKFFDQMKFQVAAFVKKLFRKEDTT